MYVLVAPCILNPTYRARGITTDEDIHHFHRAVERCRRFSIEMVPLPCPETIYLGADRPPGSFLERLATPGFTALLDRLEEEVRTTIRERREPPLAIVGVDSSPACGVNTTYYSSKKQPGRGAFLARFPEIRVVDVKDFARYRIYLAAPLFSEAEQTYNLALHDLLERHLFDVYLPQEVGDTSHTRCREQHAAIFTQHLRALRDADVVVAVIDGADADSGTSWEMGYAYALKKRVVALRTDFRLAGHHERVNLMLEESAEVVTAKEDLPGALGSLLA
ncbi:MAG TPA: nucleoside 2-deoxyribosyltransferase [Candidatus Methanoculleus thermohydrogenotrophicum]|jgi:nucleoside 2-deoxyribosyltransferase|nr:nucleoside 2-deoxyribosyltransferase [Candidatus Methanoculleus thermohydrogenotrophicum]NLM82693.1 nucleoside 2-deoxyribosyltransferase [Candidatus Methanoculleus thermohydrogenotrophicum]HOB17754.1 nucleoside 2-deoxyribosyltransferase [Candidatus Methanoculleus thermohydrogenotrophicum]HPZ37887.1 nucleoside 2-deoxyribosyltransferase [Candidatus Methanoculleus thermohydrogenotrophicum]HQC90746.1 nucleoside 2-deoxyribosyltransferase [Candidatus Methanoculleus thermohydrogenotrophicum]